MTTLATLRAACDALLARARNDADMALIERMDDAIEAVAAQAESLAELRAQHAAEMIALIGHPRIRIAPAMEHGP